MVVEDSVDAVPVAVSKPLSRVPGQVAIAGKPVATVTPMATTKPNSNTNKQPASVPAKPKVSAYHVYWCRSEVLTGSYCGCIDHFHNGD